MVKQLSITELHKHYCITSRPIHFDKHGFHNGWGKREK